MVQGFDPELQSTWKRHWGAFICWFIAALYRTCQFAFACVRICTHPHTHTHAHSVTHLQKCVLIWLRFATRQPGYPNPEEGEQT